MKLSIFCSLFLLLWCGQSSAQEQDNKGPLGLTFGWTKSECAEILKQREGKLLSVSDIIYEYQDPYTKIYNSTEIKLHQEEMIFENVRIGSRVGSVYGYFLEGKLYKVKLRYDKYSDEVCSAMLAELEEKYGKRQETYNLNGQNIMTYSWTGKPVTINLNCNPYGEGGSGSYTRKPFQQVFYLMESLKFKQQGIAVEKFKEAKNKETKKNSNDY